MRSMESLSEEERRAIYETRLLDGNTALKDPNDMRVLVAQGIALDESNDFSEVYALWDDGEYKWGNYVLHKMFPRVDNIEYIGDQVWRNYRESKG